MDWKEEARQRAARAKAKAEAAKAKAEQTPPAKAKPAPTPKPRESKPYEPPREPKPYEPPREPKPYEPKPYEPKPYEPKPYEPKPYEPKPYEPKPYEPRPDEPKPYEPPREDPVSYDPPERTAEMPGDSSPDEAEELRQQAMWQQSSGEVSLEGYVASSPHMMDPVEFRPLAARWFGSFIHGTPFTRQERGMRFLLRKDDVLRWECNVVVYGEIMGGHIHKDSRVRVTGAWYGRNHDLYASRIVTTDGPMRSEMSIRGQIHGRTVRLFTIIFGALALMLLLSIAQGLFGVTVMGGALFGNLFAYLRENWVVLLLLLGLIIYLWRRVQGRLRRTFRFRRH